MQTENYSEIKKFTLFSKGLGTKKDGFFMLKKMNMLRLQYIKQKIQLKDKKVLDIGCGHGILSEQISLMEAEVIGIDPCGAAIEIARQNSAGNVSYINTSVSEFAKQDQLFDSIFIMEVVEHVDNLSHFIKLVCSMLKDGGSIFFSTINKTIKSYLCGVLAAEYILRLLPLNTHSWQKFVKPSKIKKLFEENSVFINDLKGMKYNPFFDEWSIANCIDVNYIGFGVKKQTDCK